MTLTPAEARARLQAARADMQLATVVHRGREGYDVHAGVTAALQKVIALLEDALA